MLEVFTGLSVFTVLCLAIKALRLYGVIGVAILAMLRPAVTLALAAAGGAAYLFYRFRFI